MPTGAPKEHEIYFSKTRDIIGGRPDIKSPAVKKLLVDFSKTQNKTVRSKFPKDRTIVNMMRRIRDDEMITLTPHTETFDLFRNLGDAPDQIKLDHAHLAREVVQYYKILYDCDIKVGLVKFYVSISKIDPDWKCNPDHYSCIRDWESGVTDRLCAVQRKALMAEIFWADDLLKRDSSSSSHTSGTEYEKAQLLLQSHRGDIGKFFHDEVAKKGLKNWDSRLWRQSRLNDGDFLPQFQKLYTNRYADNPKRTRVDNLTQRTTPAPEGYFDPEPQVSGTSESNDSSDFGNREE